MLAIPCFKTLNTDFNNTITGEHTPCPDPLEIDSAPGPHFSSAPRAPVWVLLINTISEKTRSSNHLQMLGQKQHLLLNYFKTLSELHAR